MRMPCFRDQHLDPCHSILMGTEHSGEVRLTVEQKQNGARSVRLAILLGSGHEGKGTSI